MADEKRFLSTDDLLLLLKQYENTIQLNTILVEQQKGIIADHVKLSDIQKQILSDIHNLLMKINDSKDKILMSETEILKTIMSKSESCVKDHNKINTKIYGIVAIFTGLTGSLIWILITVMKEVKLLELIAKHLGVG